jgi:hypothetical protein
MQVSIASASRPVRSISRTASNMEREQQAVHDEAGRVRNLDGGTCRASPRDDSGTGDPDALRHGPRLLIDQPVNCLDYL